MSSTHVAPTLDVRSAHPRLHFHHIGIQTTDVANCASWYEEFLGCRREWSLDRFSDLTRSRLPGIRVLVEMRINDVRLHLFERPGNPADPQHSITQFQHFCFRVNAPEELTSLRQRWISLYDSGRYSFAHDDPPTEIVTDDDGVKSFYAYDVNGLELEFTYLPSDIS